MQSAIADLETVLKAISGLSIVPVGNAPSSAPFALSIGVGTLETEYFFGANKLKQQLELTLTTKGTKNNPTDVYSMTKLIKDTIELDRRRGGTAQTTIVGDWEVSEDTGREGLEQTLTVEIQVYENPIS